MFTATNLDELSGTGEPGLEAVEARDWVQGHSNIMLVKSWAKARDFRSCLVPEVAHWANLARQS